MEEHKLIKFHYEERNGGDESNNEKPVINEKSIIVEFKTSGYRANKRTSIIFVNIFLVLIKFGAHFLHK